MNPEQSGERKYRILLAEDNPADVTLLRFALKEHRIECELSVLNDGEQAIEMLQELDEDERLPRLDLLLLDMHLPRRDGIEVLQYLRSTKRLSQTPVIILSSADREYVEKRTTPADGIFFFPKPSALDEFLTIGAVVRKLIEEDRNSGEENLRSGGASAGTP